MRPKDTLEGRGNRLPSARTPRSDERSSWPGKGTKDRTLWLKQEVLGKGREWTGPRKAEAGGSEFLLPTQKGTQVVTSHLHRSVKCYVRKALNDEVDRVSPHTLRHTFATQLYRKTGNICMVQKALGHSDLSATMIYRCFVDEELEEAMKGL